MLDPNTIANIVIAGASLVGAGTSLYQAWRARGSADSARRSEDRVTTLVANTQNFAPQVHVTNVISATGAAQATAPLTPVVQPQIEERPEG